MSVASPDNEYIPPGNSGNNSITDSRYCADSAKTEVSLLGTCVALTTHMKRRCMARPAKLDIDERNHRGEINLCL